MPSRSHLLIAGVLGTLTALGGCGAALLVAGVVAALVDDGSFLSGLVEALVAATLVAALTVMATVATVRWWVSRGPRTLGWGWATLAVVAGAVATSVGWTATAMLADAVGDGVALVGLPLAIAAATPAAYAVLSAWATRSPSRD